MPAKQTLVVVAGAVATDVEAGGAQIAVADATTDVGGEAAERQHIPVGAEHDVVLVDLAAGTEGGAQITADDRIKAGGGVAVGEFGADGAEVVADTAVNGETTIEVQNTPGLAGRPQGSFVGKIVHVARPNGTGTHGEVPAVHGFNLDHLDGGGGGAEALGHGGGGDDGGGDRGFGGGHHRGAEEGTAGGGKAEATKHRLANAVGHCGKGSHTAACLVSGSGGYILGWTLIAVAQVKSKRSTVPQKQSLPLSRHPRRLGSSP